MKLNWHKATVIFALSVAMLLVIVASAFAGTAYSSYRYFTDGNYGYKNRAIVTTYSSSGAVAGTYLGSNPQVTRPAGWYGAKGRLYNSSGTLVKDSGYWYSSGPSVGIEVWTSVYNVRGSYYSKGISKSWDGSAYIGHVTNQSPNQTY